MWRNASWGRGGFLVPDVESLLVFLAVHVVGHAFERPHWQENVYRCARQVERWDEVWRIARKAKVTGALRVALEGRPPGHVEPLLDGLFGRLIWDGSLVLRGHVMPASWREGVRERISLWRQGYGFASGKNAGVFSFDGLTFVVDKGVFSPKRVSEDLVRLAVASVAGSDSPTIVEMGTGTGAISVSLARRLPRSKVFASDVSPRAVRCAGKNAARMGVEIGLSTGSLMSPIPQELRGTVDVVVANLPYVEPVGAARVGDWGAPSHAIVGEGSDGLDLVREGALQAAGFLKPGGWLVLQIADWQFEVLQPELIGMGFLSEPPAARSQGKAMTMRAQWQGKR
jgi:release factor glutamine methyltransferase